jgi:hypothetical protein
VFCAGTVNSGDAGVADSPPPVFAWLAPQAEVVAMQAAIATAEARRRRRVLPIVIPLIS